MSRLKHSSPAAGFTIIELLFSMAVFSTILLAATVGMIQIGRLYFKGVTITKTQNLTRQVMDEVSRGIQFSGSRPTLGGSASYSGVQAYSFCIGTNRYSYVIDRVLKPAPVVANKEFRHVLWRDTVRDPLVCPPLDLSQATPSDSQTTGTAGRELMSENTRLSRLSVATSSGNVDMYQVYVYVVYGDTDLLDYSTYNPGAGNHHLACQGGGIVGTQFCALSEISTVVSRRIK
jgi:prepilin-type N-terminal cleavage/methylation domain-containing protein